MAPVPWRPATSYEGWNDRASEVRLNWNELHRLTCEAKRGRGR